jgi:cysteine desulfurase
VDLYSISAHKIHGLKGIGALYVKKGISLKPYLFGGGQESGMRSGTENLPMICAFEEAVKENVKNFDSNYSKKMSFMENFKSRLLEKLPATVKISPDDNVVPNILTVAFEIIRGEVLLHSLEKHGILVGIGSACSSHRESRFKKLLNIPEDTDDTNLSADQKIKLNAFENIYKLDKKGVGEKQIANLVNRLYKSGDTTNSLTGKVVAELTKSVDAGL